MRRTPNQMRFAYMIAVVILNANLIFSPAFQFDRLGHGLCSAITPVFYQKLIVKVDAYAVISPRAQLVSAGSGWHEHACPSHREIIGGQLRHRSVGEPVEVYLLVDAGNDCCALQI